MKTIENNGVILLDPDIEKEVVIGLMFEMNAFASIKMAEILTTLDRTTQYRERKAGRFPKLYCLTYNGKRKAYRVNELMEYMKAPLSYKS